MYYYSLDDSKVGKAIMKLLDHITSSAVNTPSAVAFFGGGRINIFAVRRVF